MEAKRHSWSPHSYPLQSSPSQRRTAAREKTTPKDRPKSAYPIQSPPSHARTPAQQHDTSTVSSNHSRPSSQQFHTKSAYPIQSPPSAKSPEPVEEIVAVSTARISRSNTSKIDRNSSYPIQSSPPSRKPSQKQQAVSAYPIQAPLSDKTTEKGDTGSTVNTSEQTTSLPQTLYGVKNGREYQGKGRTIIVCLDGTGDQFDADNSNIVHLVSCLKKDDPQQITYYQSGVGTYDGGGLSNGMSAAADMAIASGLGVHIRDAYRFLMQNYNEGDKICLFGFSRGAFTARCLGGMLHKVGLLPAHNVSQILFAYKFYKDDSPQGWRSSHDFKKTFCIDVNVHFIGIFDSVASVGFIPRKLPLSSTPTNRASYFRHAMALDERRAKFKPCRFKKRDSIDRSGWTTVAETGGNPQRQKLRSNHVPPQQPHQEPPRSSTTSPTDLSTITEDKSKSEKEAPPKAKAPAAPETDVLEVWFAGCHCDVGGGAVRNDVRHKLSQIPLRWMIRQCFECDTGIIFNTRRLAEQGLDVHTLWPTYTALPEPQEGPSSSMMQKYKSGGLGPIEKRAEALEADDPGTGYNVHTWPDEQHQPRWVPEHAEDYFDAMADVHDQLSLAKTWWILELFWPIKVRVQPKGSHDWVKKVAVNLGRFRAVQEVEPNLHWTVQRRMAEKGYKMRARADRDVQWKVVT